MSQLLCRDCLAWDDDAGGKECPRCGGRRVIPHADLPHLTIAHIDCDAFYASIEKRDDPTLADKPLIIGHAGGRGVVTTACYIARRYGPRSAMPMFRALELCPDAVVRPPDMSKYRAVSRYIRAVFETVTEAIEPVALDEAYLDLHEDQRRTSEPAATSLARIARRIEDEVRITVSVGLGPNKFLAKLASDLEKPRGFSVIGASEARAFLAPLPATRINGVGKANARILHAMGITTIGELQQRSEAELITRFGKFGRRLHMYARGEDDRHVTPNRPSKSVSAETTFRSDICDAAELIAALEPLTRRVAERLVRGRLAGSTLVLKLKTADFRNLTRSYRLACPTQRADVMQETAAHLIRHEADGRAFRLIGVGLADLCPEAEADPPGLFDLL